MTPEPEAGFSLVEMVVALGVFACIGTAGIALLDTVLGVERQTAGRLDRLATIDRAMTVIAHDLEALAAGPLTGNPRELSFAARAPDGHRGTIRYSATSDALARVRDGRVQRVLDRTGAVRFRYLAPGGWRDRWSAGPRGAWPRAIAADIDLGDGGSVRRVIDVRAADR